MTTPMARCPGWGDGPEDWLTDCLDCQRRTAPPVPQQITPTARMALSNRDGSPPAVLWCEDYLSPDNLVVQRLQELVKQLEQ